MRLLVEFSIAITVTSNKQQLSMCMF